MTGEVRPPFATPDGPQLSDEGLVDSFLEGAGSGYSDELHIEDEMLLAARMVPIGVRLGDRVLLLRVDVGRAATTGREAVERRLHEQGLRKLEADARLGDVAAIQVTGVRGGIWDLWGDEAESAHRALERAVLGQDRAAVEAAGGAMQDWGAGMTLDELLEDIRQEDDG